MPGTSVTDCHLERWCKAGAKEGRDAARGDKNLAVEDRLKGLTLAPKTKSHIRSLMHTIFQWAHRSGLVEKNPIELIRVRGGSKRLETPRVLTLEEFCPPCPRNPTRTQVWVAGCLFAGERDHAAEMVGLDFEDCTLAVQRSMVHGRSANVKTEYSRDRVPLDSALMELLLAHRQGYHRTEEDWIFPNQSQPKPSRPLALNRSFWEFLGPLVIRAPD